MPRCGSRAMLQLSGMNAMLITMQRALERESRKNATAGAIISG